MIRPFTLVCMLSAFGAGLYLYQSKHQAQVLDRDIGRTIKLTESVRERTGMLRAEWALLNEPDRLAELARAHTSLQTLKPTQFVGLADVAARLPAPVADSHEKLPVDAVPEDASGAQAGGPIAQAAPLVVAPVTTGAPAKPRDAAAAEPKPKSDPKPEAKPTAVAEAKPVVRRVEKPAIVTAAPLIAAEPAPVQAREPHPQAAIASNDATAPGTVGAAVLRAMRAQNAGATTGGPAYAQPAYVQPAYTPPAYAQPAYAAPASSVLGGRALPPPVPFAAR